MMRSVVAIVLLLATGASGRIVQGSPRMIQNPEKPKEKAQARAEDLHKLPEENLKEYEEMFNDFTDESEKTSLSQLQGGRTNLLRQEKASEADAAEDKAWEQYDESWDNQLADKAKEVVDSVKSGNILGSKKKAEPQPEDRDYKSSNPTGRTNDLPPEMLAFWTSMQMLDPQNPETAQLKTTITDMFCTEYPNLSGCTKENVKDCKEIGDCTTGKEKYVVIGNEVYKVAKGFGVTKKEVVSGVSQAGEAQKQSQEASSKAIAELLSAAAPAEAITKEFEDPDTQEEWKPAQLGELMAPLTK